MKVSENGRYYERYRFWEKKKNQPYDYKHEGLLKRIMSHKIIESENAPLQYMLQTLEQSLLYCMNYIDVLNNYFNYNWKNR